MRVEGRLPDEQFVEQNPQRVDVAARVDVHGAEDGLLRAHVNGRADELLEAGEERLVGELALRGLGDAEVDDLHHRQVGVERDHDIRGLDVAVDDPFLMRVLDRRAHVAKERQPLARAQPSLVAVLRDRDALHQFHDEERPPILRRASVEDLGDVRVVHHRQRLPLALEARDDLARVHAQLDDLQRHLPHHRLHLLRHPHRAKAALANLLQELVAPDHLAALLRLEPRELRLDLRRKWGVVLHEIVRRVVRLKERHDFGVERVILAALLDEIGRALARGALERGVENGLGAHGCGSRRSGRSSRLLGTRWRRRQGRHGRIHLTCSCEIPREKGSSLFPGGRSFRLTAGKNNASSHQDWKMRPLCPRGRFASTATNKSTI